MSSLVIRAATESDLPALLGLESDAFGPDAWSRATLQETLAGDARRCVVADDDGLLGHAVVRVVGDVADLERIVVRRDARRRGIARRLLADLIDHCASPSGGDADRMLLEVSADNRAAAAFYAAEGFSQIDVRPRYYRDGSDALVLRRALTVGCGGGRP